MYPLDPFPSDRPGHQQHKLNHEQLPKDGNKAIWILGIMAGALGVAAVISAI
jgi:hypothetical protein